MDDRLITLPDGRELAFTDLGPAGAFPALFFHGAPSSRLRLAHLEAALIAAGVRVISPDRPGYGRSTPQPGRGLSDWPTDVSALADALGCDRFVAVGHSSGGPYAVACAARLGARVAGGIVLAGVTDMDWPPAWDGYLDDETRLMRMPDEGSATRACAERYGADGSRFLSAFAPALPDPDQKLLENEDLVLRFARVRNEAFRQGVGGYAQDLIVQSRPWDFDPRSIGVPFRIVHGDMDTLLPLAHSRHTADLIPGSTLEVLTGHGHFTVLGEIPRLMGGIVREAA